MGARSAGTCIRVVKFETTPAFRTAIFSGIVHGTTNPALSMALARLWG